MGERIDLPPTLQGDEQAQLKQMWSYLYQLSEAINNNLNAIGGNDLTDSERMSMQQILQAAGVSQDEVSSEYETLKSLIIKTADFVQTSLQEYRMVLFGETAASGQFGQVNRRTGMDVAVTPDGVLQKFSLREIVKDLKTYEVNAKNYIKTGYLRTENSIPIYGVAIGKDVVTFSADGTETYNDGNKVAELTADELSFWQNNVKIAKYTGSRISFLYNGTEAFYIQNGKWYAVGDMEITNGKKLILASGADMEVSSGGDMIIKSGGTMTVQNSSNNNIIKMSNAGLDIESGGDINVKSGGDLIVKSGGTVQVQNSSNNNILKMSNAGLDVESGGDINVKSGGDVIIKSGGTVQVQNSSNNNILKMSNAGLDVESSGTVTVKSGGNMNVKSGGTLTVQNSSNNNVIKLSNTGIDVESGGDINVKSGGDVSIKSGGSFSVESGGSFLVNNTNFVADSQNKYIRIGDTKINETGSHYEIDSATFGKTITSFGSYEHSSISEYPKLSVTTLINPHSQNQNLTSQTLYFTFQEKSGAFQRMHFDNKLNEKVNVYCDGKLTPNGSIGYVGGKLGISGGGEWDVEANTVRYYTLTQMSSRYKKQDIKQMEPVGEKIDKLEPVTFIYKNDQKGQRRTGLIYEDAVNVMPEICTDAGGEKAINYVEMIPMLLKEIQDLRARVKALEER